MPEFEDQVVIVTGGAQGTGAAICRAFAEAGATVVVSDLDGDRADELARDLTATGSPPAVGMATDVAHPDACEALVERTFAQLGGVDVLVNCAGIFARTPAIEMTDDDWTHMFDVCIHGAFWCSRALARRLIERHAPGAIVNISSTASTHSAPGVSAYSAAKAALSSLTRSLGVEWAPHRIRVNAVAPGHVNVDRLRAAAARGFMDLDAVARSIPAGRMAEPAEVAEAVMFLAGDRAGFITSQVLFVDGGFSVPPIYR